MTTTPQRNPDGAGSQNASLHEPETERDACGVGFVAHIHGEKSRSIVTDALTLLARLSHRAATGCDAETGDGAGILLQLPHRFFKREGLRLGFEMPRRRRYGVGQVFLPRDPAARALCEEIFEATVAQEGQRVLGWRDVPVDPSCTGRIGRDALPVFRQIYIARRRCVPSAFERKLYVIRKLVENRIRERGIDVAGPLGRGTFHVASLSADTIVYKGLLLPGQLPHFYDDLSDPDMVSGLALVHSRFSTNTLPTWDLAQPFRFIAHNGEINTVRGNRHWTNARRQLLQSAKFDGGINRLFPIVVPGKSDSAQFDNMLELLSLGGRTLPHAMMMMIPEAWEENPYMDDERRAFYQYASALMEPWDGPAAIAFTDGNLIGATLDRNGLRPARYVVTEDDRVVLASEAGALDIPIALVKRKGRLQPGRMFLVDTTEGRILHDEDVKRDIAQRFPYRRWLQRNVFPIEQLQDGDTPPVTSGEALLRLQRAFGYTEEDVRMVLTPMGDTGKEPVGSMGNDTPLAVLSDQAPALFDYFHQLFAQVTNPPIDPIREALVMTLATALGPDGNTFEETPEQCHRISLSGPIITNAEVAKLAAIGEGAFEPAHLSLLYSITHGAAGVEGALGLAVDALTAQALAYVEEGVNILILSDRGVDETHAAIPSLLALSAVHQRLVREGIRMHTGLVVETAEVREVHHAALLIGYGAAAVNPYLALDTVRELATSRHIATDADTAERNFVAAIHEGILKVMSKMGISALSSYCGAQIFEAVGIAHDLIEQHFTGTPSRIGGIGLDLIHDEVKTRHARGFVQAPMLVAAPPVVPLVAIAKLPMAPPPPPPPVARPMLPVGGLYHFRRDGERHRWSPSTVHALQAAVRKNDRGLFDAYIKLADHEDEHTTALRGLLEIAWEAREPVPLDEVEPALDLVKRFVSGAMSFGAISAEAHETLAIAMNRLGARSNSGEGGEEAHRYVRDANGDSRRSAIKQVASGRFGVTTEYLVNAEELQIKIAQGAKPGEGGQLPGPKVDERIARARGATPGVSLISPPPHHDIYSIEDLAQLHYDLASVNPAARITVKLVSEVGIGPIAAGCAKAGASGVVVAGFEGGTGAAPLSSLRHAGLPWELGLAETQQVLVQNELRGRIRVQVDGGLRTPKDVIIAALMGAEEVGMATSSLISEGCVMQRRCHLNTCSVGVATHDPELRKRFVGKPEHVVHFFLFICEGVRELMAKLGFRHFQHMVGHVELLRQRTDVTHAKAKHLDLAALLARPVVRDDVAISCIAPQKKDVSGHRDHELIAAMESTLAGGPPSSMELVVNNTDRALGAMISGEIARRHGSAGLVDSSVHVSAKGSAGQSFGAFAVNGVTLELEGEANDYVGKGLSGGRLVLFPPRDARFVPEENVLVGNTALYGATSGEAYLAGLAGERFAVRNSGARAVVEGIGDHGCEYMTGGVVVVLGPTGRNFAAGMSGGTAYVFDRERMFRQRCNLQMVELLPLVDESDVWLVHGLIENHHRHTASPLSRRILHNWEHLVPHFVKVIPLEYKRVLAARRAAQRMPTSAIVDGERIDARREPRSELAQFGDERVVTKRVDPVEEQGERHG